MSSQENVDIPSSPPVPSKDRQRRPPTVTPNRFNRFFNPDSSQSSLRESKSSRALRSLTASAANSRALASQHESEDDFPSLRPAKKRKHALQEDCAFEDFTDVSFQSSPLKSSPCIDHSARRPPNRACFPDPVTRAKGIYRITVASPNTWRSQTANFFSNPEDSRAFDRVPYCTAPCNTNSLIAIGDEGGNLNIVDTAADRDFQRSLITMKPHNNAIMDLTFSPNDKRLATVAGDKYGRVIDVQTQATIYTLWAGHVANPKQVIFQPGNENGLATCGRDGAVHLWDIRMSPKPSTIALRGSEVCPDVQGDLIRPQKSIQAGLAGSSSLSRGGKHDSSMPASPHTQSVTSVRFLPHQPYLFVTSSAASSRLYVWDVRSRTQSQGVSTKAVAPVSVTAQLPSNARTRSYGVSDLTFSPCGARLYAVCKDSTVHVYSAPHLVLGQDMSIRQRPKQDQYGALPLYRLRHPKFVVDTFFVRAAIRRASHERCEMLAVGNSNEAPVLFPTDERAHQSFAQTRLTTSTWEDEEDYETIPDVSAGTRLTRGHAYEVSSVSWTHDGDLVSASDDRSVRVWREGATEARRLRRCGEIGGERWRCGWSDIGADWDDAEE